MDNGIEIYGRAYASKLVYSKLKEAGLPVFFIGEKLITDGVSKYYDQNFVILKAHGETSTELHRRLATSSCTAIAASKNNECIEIYDRTYVSFEIHSKITKKEIIDRNRIIQLLSKYFYDQNLMIAKICGSQIAAEIHKKLSTPEGVFRINLNLKGKP